MSAESICTWRRQDRTERGLRFRLRSAEKPELTAAKSRIAELKAEVAIHGRASELLEKALRGQRGRPGGQGKPIYIKGLDQVGAALQQAIDNASVAEALDALDMPLLATGFASEPSWLRGPGQPGRRPPSP